MNNTLSLIMLSCMALFAVYVIIRLYTEKPADSKTGTLGTYIIVGGILGAIIGWFIGLHNALSLTIRSEGDEFIPALSSLFFAVLIGFTFMFAAERKHKNK